MMAVAYAVQGAWWPLLAVHLQDLQVPGRARGWIFATLSIASLVTPLFAGHIADLWMPAQRLLALIYALGSGLLALFASGAVRSPLALFALFLLYWLLVAPGLSLCATIAFRNLSSPTSQFGGVRMWGTIGWMAVGWVVSCVMLARGSARAGQGSYEAFAVAAVLSAALSVFSLTLPNTPPLMRKSRRASRRFAEWLELVREPSVVLLLLLALGVSTTTPFVYQVVPAYLLNLGLARPWIATAMSLGQVPEIVLLLVLPRILGLFGFRGTLGLGITAWVAYHGVMGSNLALALALVGVPLQGLGIALFSITGPIYLDSQVPSDRRASGQALYITATAGIGNLLGSLLAGEIVSRVGFVSAPVFLTPLIINLALLSIFIIAFRPRPREETPGLRQLAANADQIQESFDSTSPT
jgi:MFS family permease